MSCFSVPAGDMVSHSLAPQVLLHVAAIALRGLVVTQVERTGDSPSGPHANPAPPGSTIRRSLDTFLVYCSWLVELQSTLFYWELGRLLASMARRLEVSQIRTEHSVHEHISSISLTSSSAHHSLSEFCLSHMCKYTRGKVQYFGQSTQP